MKYFYLFLFYKDIKYFKEIIFINLTIIDTKLLKK